MSQAPTLTTERLVLRPFTPEDAPAVHTHLADYEVAATTASIPYPYPEGSAQEWISTHAYRYAAGEAVVLAVTLRDSGALAGSIEIRRVPAHRRAEMGYWIGRTHWGCGYATEAADALLRWAFAELGLHRVTAAHLTRNPASGKVLLKIGMRHEGRLRKHFLKWGVLEDLDLYGVLESELPPPAVPPAFTTAGDVRP
jgi:ribosomal-protein-alanine N-acetyltransferase